MGELLALASVHWRGECTHWPATSRVGMQWAGSRAQGHGAPPLFLHLSGAARRRVAHATRECRRTAARKCVHHTASASRLPMHGVLELVRHENTKCLVFEVRKNAFPFL